MNLKYTRINSNIKFSKKNSVPEVFGCCRLY